MAKDIVINNGSLSVALDSYGQVRMIHYPDASCGNHVGDDPYRHKIGVYCDDAVHWLDDGAWKVHQGYYPGRLIARTIADNLWLGIRLEIQDYIDSEFDVLIRNIHVINLSGRERSIKLYLHQSFVINDNHQQIDTAQYIPADSLRQLAAPSILHYRGNRMFLITGKCCSDDGSFTEYSVGHYGKYDDGNYMSGVWCDAADGHLAGNTREQGHTDSIIGFPMHLSAHDSAHVNYCLAAGSTIDETARSLSRIIYDGTENRTRKTAEHWLEWLAPAVEVIKHDIQPNDRYDIVDGIVAMRSTLSNNGAVISYTPHNEQPVVQPITSAAVALAFARYGLDIDACRIYDFFAKAISKNYPECVMPTYQADGSWGLNNYSYATTRDNALILPIDITDTAVVLYSLCRSIELYSHGKSVPAEWRKLWAKLGKPLADFLSDYIDPATKLPYPSYDAGSSSQTPCLSSRHLFVVHSALTLSASVAERLKDMGGVIKYQTVANDISENSGKLWSESAHGVNLADMIKPVQIKSSLFKLATHIYRLANSRTANEEQE